MDIRASYQMDFKAQNAELPSTASLRSWGIHHNFVPLYLEVSIRGSGLSLLGLISFCRPHDRGPCSGKSQRITEVFRGLRERAIKPKEAPEEKIVLRRLRMAPRCYSEWLPIHSIPEL